MLHERTAGWGASGGSGVRMTSGLILFGHGSRVPGWDAPFLRLRDRIAQRRPDWRIGLAWLEFMSPGLEDAVGALAGCGCERICIVPLFLGPGAHFLRDYPVMLAHLRQRFPQLDLTDLCTPGDSEIVLAALTEWIVMGADGQNVA